MSVGIIQGNALAIGIIQATLDPASVAANTTAEQTFTVAGLNTTDIVVVKKPSATAGVGIVGARVSAANTLAITFVNATGLAVDPASEVYTIVVIRPDGSLGGAVAF